MPLTPDDIVNHEFKQALRGYAIAEVDELLDRLADQLEATEQELAQARERLEVLEGQLASVAEREATVSRALLAAQETAERAVREARAQAAELLDEAERSAASVRAEASEQAERSLAEAEEHGRRREAAATAVVAAELDRGRAIQQLDEDHRRALEQHLRRVLDALGALPPGDLTELHHRHGLAEGDHASDPTTDAAEASQAPAGRSDDVADGHPADGHVEVDGAPEPDTDDEPATDAPELEPSFAGSAAGGGLTVRVHDEDDPAWEGDAEHPRG